MTIKQKLKYWIAFERGHYGAALEVDKWEEECILI